jgi:hypothetical protein
VAGIKGEKRMDHLAENLVAAIDQQAVIRYRERHEKLRNRRVFGHFPGLSVGFDIDVVPVQQASPADAPKQLTRIDESKYYT